MFGCNLNNTNCSNAKMGFLLMAFYFVCKIYTKVADVYHIEVIRILYVALFWCENNNFK